MASLNLLQIAGILLLAGGLVGLWGSLRARRQGNPWQGNGLTSLAWAVYGGLTLAGLVFNGTFVGAIIMGALVAAVFTGMLIARRERRMTSR